MTEQRIDSARRPRSLADDLRGRSSEELGELLRRRPDLLRAQDLAQLAVMAGHDRSVATALDSLDSLALQVAEACCAIADAVAVDDVIAAFGAAADDELAAAVARAFESLRLMALLWGDGVFAPVSALRRLTGPYPCGLAPASLSAHRPMMRRYARDPESLEAELAEAPEESSEILRRLAQESPVGTVEGADRPVSRESARTPLEWLLARDLVVAAGPSAVVIPREVALHLRGGAVLPRIEFPPPSVAGRGHGLALVDMTAGQSAFDLVESVRALLEWWTGEPPPVLRKGGLSMRDLGLVAERLNLAIEDAGLVVEVVAAAQLVANDEQEEPSWVPTDAADDWLERTPAQQWRMLVDAWFAMPADPTLIGAADSSATKGNALTAAITSESIRSRRRGFVGLLDGLPEGVAPDRTRIVEAMQYQQPRLDHSGTTALAREAEFLGLTGLGALSTSGRDVMHGRTAKPRMPERVDHVIIQNDLTIVSGGPLRIDLARELAVLADVESTGAARVYRVTDASLQRAFDSGRDAAGLRDFLTQISRTPIPQALDYMITDTGRRQGSVRVGSATTYVRCDDQAALADIVARLDRHGLRLIAPTVAVSSAAPATILAALRGISAAAVLEGANGLALVGASSRHRTRRPLASALPSVDAVVRRLLGAEQSDGLLAVIEDAIDGDAPLLIACAGPRGDVTEHVVRPVSVAAGRLTASTVDGATATYPVERIVSAVPCG